MKTGLTKIKWCITCLTTESIPCIMTRRFNSSDSPCKKPFLKSSSNDAGTELSRYFTSYRMNWARLNPVGTLRSNSRRPCGGKYIMKYYQLLNIIIEDVFVSTNTSSVSVLKTIYIYAVLTHIDTQTFIFFTFARFHICTRFNMIITIFKKYIRVSTETNDI